MKSFFQTQWQEILNSRALQFYGGLLALTHLLSAYFWMDRYTDLVVKATETGTALCWPLAPFCNDLRFENAVGAAHYLEFYSLLAVLSAGLFFFGKVRSGYFSLLVLFLMKMFFTSLSYGLMGNYHYMSFYVQIAFFFIPHKKTVIPFLIGLFYWGAGILKFDPEWLTGVSLIVPSFLPPILQHLSLIYAVILECFLVLGLFSSRPWIRWFTLSQFFLFHIFSWHIVGYFYPLTMFLVLGIFLLIPLCKENWQALFKKSILKQKSTIAFIVIFMALQILPTFFVADPATSGAPRILSLNMLDARIQCETLLIRHQDKSEEVYNPFQRTSSIRTQCDPLIFLSQLKDLCKDPQEKFDFWLQSKRTTEPQYKTRLFIKDICSKNPSSLLWAEVL